ncbi:hypothetical protein SALBM135S_10112 [Streptomyces alboniger]
MRLSSPAFMPWVLRRSRALMTYVPMPPMTSAAAATPSSARSWPRALAVISSMVMPALTSPMIRPPSASPALTGVTTRTEGPSVPVYVSEKVRPRSASAVCPRKRSPMRRSSGWVQRMPRGSMIVTKSTPVCRCTRSA